MVVEQSQAEALAAAAAAGNNLICQAIINSGIALGTEESVVEETSQTTEEIHKVDSDCPDIDEGITEIQIKEEFVEMEGDVGVCFNNARLHFFKDSSHVRYINLTHTSVFHLQETEDGDDQTSLKLHTCPHCNRSFKGLNYFRFHVKGHLGKSQQHYNPITV